MARRSSATLALALVGLLGTSGCSSLSPGGYQSFDDWFTGNPESDYDDLGAESVPVLNRVRGLAFTPSYLKCNLCRIAMIAVTLPYFALRGEPD
jgi:hypothetical protein